MYLKNKESVHQVGKKEYYYIRVPGQQNIKKIKILRWKSCFQITVLIKDNPFCFKAFNCANHHRTQLYFLCNNVLLQMSYMQRPERTTIRLCIKHIKVNM